jgi:heptosyltransferase-1
MRVVLVRLSALGDVIHTWPLALALRATQPDMHLTWVVEEPFRPLVEGHPAVDAVLACSTRRWRRSPFSAETQAEVGHLRTRLAELAPELCLDPQGVLKSAMVTRWSRAARRLGLARPWRRELLPGLAYTEQIPGSTRHPHVVATNLELVRALGATPPAEPPFPDGRWLAERSREALPPGLPRTAAVLLPGAGQESKILPVEALAAVAQSLVADGLPVVVAWGPAESGRAASIVRMAGDPVRLAPPTDLIQLAALLADAALVIGGDTGPIHLAASLGTPTVAVFLTTDPQRNGPLGPRTAIVSAARRTATGPTGSARARQVRGVAADEIVTSARDLLATSDPRCAAQGPGPEPTDVASS